MNENLIFDIGVNNGDDSAYYLHKGFRVVGVEANPRLNAALKIRFSEEIKTNKFVLVEGAVSESSGRVVFYINDWIDEWSATDADVAGRERLPTTKMEVDAITVDSLFESYGVPFYLKSDIEGGDPLVLNALRKTDLPKYVSVEAHSLDYLKQLQNLGYKDFKCVDQQDHCRPDSLPLARKPSFIEKIKTPLRELYSKSRFLRWAFTKSGLIENRIRKRLSEIETARKPLDESGAWVFPPGSSGPFGEESWGDWKSFNEVANDWSAWMRKDFKNSSLHPQGWFDFHARR